MHAVTGLIKTGDTALFLLFNTKIRCRFLSYIMRTVTQLGTLLFSVSVSIALLLFPNMHIRSVGSKVAATLIASQIIVQSVKRIVNRPRPYRILDQAIAVKPPACKYSFPSGHTSAAFAIAFALSSGVAGLGLLFYTLALLVGISRMYLGFHYPTDVLAGYAISYVSFILISSYSLPFFR